MNTIINVDSVIKVPNFTDFITLPQVSIQRELSPIPLDIVGQVFYGSHMLSLDERVPNDKNKLYVNVMVMSR